MHYYVMPSLLVLRNGLRNPLRAYALRLHRVCKLGDGASGLQNGSGRPAPSLQNTPPNGRRLQTRPPQGLLVLQSDLHFAHLGSVCKLCPGAQAKGLLDLEVLPLPCRTRSRVTRL